MPLFRYSIAQSLSPENPWVRQIAGIGSPARALSRRMPINFCAAAVVVCVLSWLTAGVLVSQRRAYLWDPDDGLSAAVIFSLGTLAALIATCGPRAGANARRRLAASALLPDSLITPVTGGQYHAAMQGRLLLWSACGGMFVQAICVLAFPFAIENPGWISFAAWFVASLIIGVNFAAGFLYRATMLATHYEGRSSALGVSAFLLILGFFSIQMRAALVALFPLAIAGGARLLFKIQDPATHTLIALSTLAGIAVIEGIDLSARLEMIRDQWYITEEQAIPYLRKSLKWDT